MTLLNSEETRPLHPSIYYYEDNAGDNAIALGLYRLLPLFEVIVAVKKEKRALTNHKVGYFVKQCLKNTGEELITAIVTIINAYTGSQEADMKKEDAFDESLLVSAAVSGKRGLDIIKLFVDETTYIDNPDFQQIFVYQSVLDEVVKNGHIEAVKLLVTNKNTEFKECINNEDFFSEKYTPLHKAVINEHLDMVKLLLDNNANVNAKTTVDKTPLHFAIENENLEIAQLLINRNADINIQDIVNVRNVRDKTALDCAEEYEHQTVIKLLTDSSLESLE